MGVAVFVTLWLPVRVFRRLAAVMITVTTILLVLVLIPHIGIEATAHAVVQHRRAVGAALELCQGRIVRMGAHVLGRPSQENASLKELLIHCCRWP